VASNTWVCWNCRVINEDEKGMIGKSKVMKCSSCNFPRADVFQTVDAYTKCPNPKCDSRPWMSFEHCQACHTRVIEPQVEGSFAQVEAPETVVCYAPRTTTLVAEAPSVDSVGKYYVGRGDLMPLLAEEDEFCEVLLPGGETGFAPKSAGFLAEVGLGEVTAPLGYVRVKKFVTRQGVMAPQPDGEEVLIHVAAHEERYPVVAEREDTYVIQLEGGMRGHIHKGAVIRTLGSGSLPVEEPISWGKILGAAALVGLGMAAQASSHSHHVARDTRTVVKTMREL
jgi:hypothetical protein